jgi:serine/threonine protein kinase
MRAGGVLPGRGPPVRAEVLHESETMRVTRLFLPGRTVIRKEPLEPDAQRRLRHERVVLVMHRDIAPANIVIFPDGTLCLVDFIVRRDSPRVHPPQRNRGDVGVPRAGADRAHGAVGGSACRPVRVGRHAV